MLQPNDKAVAVPKLDVATIDQALGLVDCLGIIDGNQCLKSDEVPIEPDRIHPVFQLAALLREALTRFVKYTSEHTGLSFGVYVERNGVRAPGSRERCYAKQILWNTREWNTPSFNWWKALVGDGKSNLTMEKTNPV